MIGQTILHYKITSKLGEGGMGEVYLATDTKLDRPVALKFLPPALQAEPEARERLLREAKAASKLNHKNILTIHDVAHADGRDFIVMEYVEGQSLKEIIDTGEPLPLEQALRIGLQICDGLATAANQGVVHRDIKPANILVTSNGHVKITDFGLATWRGATKLTKDGSTVGTAGYMSPEQVQGGVVDSRSDLFSFGVVLYELMTGRLPFRGDHDAAIAYAIVNEAPEPLARYKSGLPAGLQEVISRALEKDPSMRYQSAGDLLADLKRNRRDSGGSKPSMVTPLAQPMPKRKSYLKYVATTSAVVVIAVILLVLKPFKFEVASEQKATANENSLAVLYFDNVADPDDKDKTAQMITSLLITGLSESQYLQVTSRQHLYDILSQLGKGNAKSVDRTTASQVAAKANVRLMVTGEVLQVTPRIVLTAEVSEAASGKLVTTQKVSGEPGEDVFAVADRLGKAIRSNLALPAQAQTEPTKPLASVTTRSQEAYRYYTEGSDYAWRYYAKEARASYERALTYDSTFAMVYYQLTLLPDLAGEIEEKQRLEWIAKAEKYAANAGEKDQYYIRAGAHALRGETGEALADYTRLLERYPREIQALWSKGLISREAKRLPDALEAFQRMVQVDPEFADAYNQLAYTNLYLGNEKEAFRALDRYQELTPNDANPYDSRGDLYSYIGKPAEAAAAFRRALQLNPSFGSDVKLGCMYLYAGDYVRTDSLFQAMARSADRIARSKGRTHLHLVASYQGRFREAARILDQAIAADRMEGYDGLWYLGKFQQRVLIHVCLGEFAEAIALQRHVCELEKKADPTTTDNGRSLLFILLSKKGDRAGAQNVYDSLRHDILALPDTVGRTSNLHVFAAYHSLLLDNDPKAACANFEQSFSVDHIPSDAYYFGGAYLSLGELEKATKTLERGITYLDLPFAYMPFFGVKCHYLLGQAYEKSGLKDKAAQEYKIFLDIWKNADPGIKEIDDAKARLAKLTT